MNNISKYDMPMEILSTQNETSHGKILKQIKSGSRVLECGCATGYMTRYMKEIIGAEVYIIEYDQKAFDQAIQFAVDGICADLMTDFWLDKFQEIKFDYILFADVLEHLTKPESVLRKAASLLKNDGKIIISIPNVTHNDVIMSMCANRWRYSSIGLLDETHLRFFGEEDLDDFAHQAELAIVLQDGTYKAMSTTEQRCDNQEINRALFQILKKRPFGEVYQFVLTLQKEKYVKENKILKQVCYPFVNEKDSKLYYAENEKQLSEDKCIKKKYISDDYYNMNFSIPSNQYKCLRFDPIENSCCIVRNLEIHAEGKLLDIFPVNGVRCGNYDIFCTEDPQYYLDVPINGVSIVNIRGWIMPLDDEKLIEALKELQSNIMSRDDIINQLKRSSIEADQNRNDALRQHDEERKKFQKEIEYAIKKGEELRDEYELDRKKWINEQKNLDAANRKLELELVNKQAILNELYKEKKLLEEQNEEMSFKFEKEQEEKKMLKNKLSEIEKTNEILQEAYSGFLQSTSWRITAPLRWVKQMMKK